MSHRKRLFTVSFAAASVLLLALIALVLLSQVAVALLPVLGIGGVMLDADDFNGEEGAMYPQKGQLADHHDRVTDTAACEERPMLVLDLKTARINGYRVFKDIELPFYDDWWMTIHIDQPTGTIEAEAAKIYVTQLQVDEFVLDNVEVRTAGPDGTSTDKWGSESGEFIMRGDPQGDTPEGEEDLFAEGATAWLHALTGEQVTFVAGDEPVELGLTFQDSDDIQERYDDMGLLEIEDKHREDYFDCLPEPPEA